MLAILSIGLLSSAKHYILTGKLQLACSKGCYNQREVLYSCIWWPVGFLHSQCSLIIQAVAVQIEVQYIGESCCAFVLQFLGI